MLHDLDDLGTASKRLRDHLGAAHNCTFFSLKYKAILCTLSIVSEDDLGAATKRLQDDLGAAPKRLQDDLGAAQNCLSHLAIENTIKLEIKRDNYVQRLNRLRKRH